MSLPVTVGAMEMGPVMLELLRPAVDRLRSALRRMDDDDVPAPLRRVADSSARRLPPPLLRRAVEELDDSDWLRAETAAEEGLEEARASALFVERPPGWQEELSGLVREESQQRQSRRRSEAAERLEEAQATIDRLEKEAGRHAEELAAAQQRIAERMRGRIETAEKGRRRAEEQARQEASQFATAQARASRLEAELAAAMSRLDNLRQLLEKERRASATIEEDGRRRGWFPERPIEMAEELDRIVTAVRRPPVPVEPAPGDVAPVLAFPEGIRPDRAEAVRWLMRHTATWLLDGYNLAFLLDPDPDKATRARVVAATGQLVSLAETGTMAVVVFDSSVDASSIPADRRVRVVYAPSADEWILDQARSGYVVVSSDRRVREGSEEAGAIGIWSQAMVGWMEAGGTIG